VVTAEFVEEGSKTRLTVSVRYPSQEVVDMLMASGMAKGAGISYDRLEALLAELAISAGHSDMR
jgi:Activator of Hsp90 ATPase homolog 1-like protein